MFTNILYWWWNILQYTVLVLRIVQYNNNIMVLSPGTDDRAGWSKGSSHYFSLSLAMTFKKYHRHHYSCSRMLPTPYLINRPIMIITWDNHWNNLTLLSLFCSCFCKKVSTTYVMKESRTLLFKYHYYLACFLKLSLRKEWKQIIYHHPGLLRLLLNLIPAVPFGVPNVTNGYWYSSRLHPTEQTEIVSWERGI